MATETRHSGTLRTDLEANLARLGDLPVMESDRDRLLHRLVRGSEGTERYRKIIDAFGNKGNGNYILPQ